MIPEGAIPFSELDLSKLQADTESRPPAGAIPADQLDPSKLTQADGPPAGAIPADSIPASALQTEDQYLGSIPRKKIVEEYRVARDQGATPDKYQVAYRKQGYTLNLRDTNTSPQAAPADASAIPGVGFLKSQYGMGVDIAEGTFSALNEAAKTVGLDVMAARMKTPEERALQPGGTPFLLPAITQDQSLQSVNTVVSTAHAKSLQALDLIRTFTNRISNKIFAQRGSGEPNVGTENIVPDASMDATLNTQFNHDVAVADAIQGVEQGAGALGKNLPAPDPATMATVAKSPLLDPTMYIPAGASFNAARATEGLAARTLADAPVSLGEHALGEAGKILSRPVAVAAKSVAKAGELVDTNPMLKALAAATVTGALGGDAVQSGLAALVGANTRLSMAGKLGEGMSTKLSNVADMLAGKVLPGPMGRFGMSVAKTLGDETASVVAGQVMNLPFALGAGDEDGFKDMLTAGVLMHGAMKPVGALVNGLDVARNLWAERPTMPDSRLNVKPYGFDDALDAAHRKVADSLGNSANNYVQLIRDYFGKNRGEIYTLYPSDYNAAIDNFVAAGHLDATTALQAKSQQGLAVRVPGEDGVVRNIALSRVAGAAPGLSVGHESGHLLENLLSPEEISHVYAEIAKTYGPEQMDAYKTRYEYLANQDNTSTKIVLSPQQLLSEIFADHASAVLNSIPIERFSSPDMKTKDLSRSIYGMVARGLEKIGAKTPELVDFSGESTPRTGLGISPSAKIGGIIENVLQAHALDLPKLKQVFDTPSGKPPISKEQATLGKTPKPAAEAKPAEPSIGPTHPVTDTTPFGAHVAPAGTAEAIVAARQTENVVRPEGVPNVRVQPSAQNAFGEATQERIAKTLEHLDKAFSGQRSGIAPVEIVYHSAKSDVEGPDQKTREAQRIAADRLEKASKDAGLPNPLRAKYQKITVPYGYAHPDKSLIKAMSLDKVISNVDLLQGWLHLNPDANKNGDLSQYLASPDLTRDFQTYLENQSHGYAGSGQDLVRPSNTREGTVTPKDESYTPKPLPPDKAQVLNMLMGMEQPGKMTPGQEYAARFARENGIEAPRVKGASGSLVTDTNPTRAALRNEHGFDPKILNAAVEVLKTNRIVDLKERKDLNFKAGDVAFQKAGFMPQLKGPKLEHSVPEKELKLVHYGDPGLSEINGSKFGRSGVTPRSELAGAPRSYWYEANKENRHDIVLGRGSKYNATVSGNRIYDGDSDPLNYGSKINRWKADDMLQNAGYAGIRRTAGRGKNAYSQVELFEPVKPVDSSTVQPSVNFMPNGQRDGNDETRALAREYMDAHGITAAQHTENAPVNVELAKKIADFYDEAKHDPQAPDVKRAYDALAKETMAQYAEMEKAGIKIQPWDGKGEPYANSAAMMQDVRDNKHLWFFKTDNGFGEAKAPDNALLEKSGVKVNGHELLVNDVFRAVHDFFGHTAEGWEFGPRGELNAYLTHAKMFSDEAKPALAAETLAQNSWVNYGKHLRDASGAIPAKGEPGYVPLKERKFADQKNIAIPHAFLREAEGLPPEAPLARAKVKGRGALSRD